MKQSIFWIFTLVLIANACIYKKLDTDHYSQSIYYHQTIDSLNKLYAQYQFDTTVASSHYKVGWSKVNITPPIGTPLAGYSRITRRNIEAIEDSTFVRILLIENRSSKVAIICSDMLLFPMEVRKSLFQELNLKTQYKPQELYLTATHTHHGSGGWGRRVLGRAIAGKYSYKSVRMYKDAVILGIQEASKNMQDAVLSYAQIPTSGLVSNRLNNQDRYIDTTLRILSFETIHTRQKGIWVTFSAHATSIYSKLHILSADYPGKLSKTLEEQYSYSWAGFSAAGVASHSTTLDDTKGHQYNLKYYADTLSKIISLGIGEKSISNQSSRLRTFSYPLYHNSPQLRLTDEKVLAPWLFYSFLGKYDSYITVSQIGNILLVGTPCDFSGQLTLPLEEYAKSKNINLIITSFNGAYMGYITPDKYYNLKKYETRDMNLFGKNGDYFSELIRNNIDFISNSK